MNFRNISSWCIRNPVPPIVLFVGLMLAGIIAFMGMEVNNNPDIDFPAAQITIAQPGAAPTEMENQITQKVEAAVRSVNGVDESTVPSRRQQQHLRPVQDRYRARSTMFAIRRPDPRRPPDGILGRKSAGSTSPAIRSSMLPPKPLTRAWRAQLVR
jgi:hypothetical protein